MVRLLVPVWHRRAALRKHPDAPAEGRHTSLGKEVGRHGAHRLHRRPGRTGGHQRCPRLSWRSSRTTVAVSCSSTAPTTMGPPGGGHEIGESIAGTVVREVKEETGYDVEVLALTGIYTNPATSWRMTTARSASSSRSPSGVGWSGRGRTSSEPCGLLDRPRRARRPRDAPLDAPAHCPRHGRLTHHRAYRLTSRQRPGDHPPAPPHVSSRRTPPSCG